MESARLLLWIYCTILEVGGGWGGRHTGVLTQLLHNARSGELVLLTVDTLQEGYTKVEQESTPSRPSPSRSQSGSPCQQLCKPAESVHGL